MTAYSKEFCKVYNEFGWNYFPEAFGEQLLEWIREKGLKITSCLDIGCGTGILCDLLHREGMKTMGIDLSEDMIRIAGREHGSEDCCFEQADMVTFRSEQKFDLVTCTGDALNHILDLADVDRVFGNVASYLNNGGYFIFDILDEREAGNGEAIDLDYSETVKARFQILRQPDHRIILSTKVYENGVFQFEEQITEIIHDPGEVCRMLERHGFKDIQCRHHLLESEEHETTTWFIIATY